MKDKTATDDKIMDAFAVLVNEQGYSATTTSQLAKKAGVNESTIFRHFGDKMGLANELVKRYRSTIVELMDEFTPSWELEDDLIEFSKRFRQQWPRQNIMLVMFNTTKDPEQKRQLRDMIEEIRDYGVKMIIDYFKKIQQSGKIRSDINYRQLALNFVWLNIGQFWSSRFWEGDHRISDAEFYELSVRPFADLLIKKGVFEDK